ncbi:hypothetical protein HMPREF9056_00510 [Actinomyces sp. oral taxon 170 str. F0386]|nr:hypothetical protein HMPREF9056_00510 [Actinomyces sp. oral taxon 170 str. F0386]
MRTRSLLLQHEAAASTVDHRERLTEIGKQNPHSRPASRICLSPLRAYNKISCIFVEKILMK